MGSELSVNGAYRLGLLAKRDREYAFGDSIMRALERQGYAELDLTYSGMRTFRWRITRAGRVALSNHQPVAFSSRSGTDE